MAVRLWPNVGVVVADVELGLVGVTIDCTCSELYVRSRPEVSWLMRAIWPLAYGGSDAVTAR